MRVIVFFVFQPNHKEWEVIFDLFPVENSVDHMTTKQPHFDFISGMAIKFFVLMN